MKIFVVVASFAYDGYGNPIGVFSTLTAAKAILPTLKDYDEVDIIQYEIDVPNSGQSFK